MPTRRYDTPDGELTLWMSLWSGKETIRHRGAIVSEDRSFSLVSHHRFMVPGGDGMTAIQYELWYGLFWGWHLKRNGVTVAEERSGGLLSWAFSFGLLVIFLTVIASLVDRVAGDALAALPQGWPPRVTRYVLPVSLAGAFPLAWWIRRRTRDRLKR